MEYKKIGKSDLEVSKICIGAWQWGGQWGEYDVKEIEKIIDIAIEKGVNFLDTAEAYGESENVVGKVLQGKRDKFILATKIGGNNFDYKTAKERLEGSLKKLKTDYVDLYQIHWPKMKHLWHKEDMSEKDYEDITESMIKLKKEGLIRWAGVSNFRAHHLKNFPEEAFSVIVSNQVPYSILWRCYDFDGTTDFCKEKGITYLAYSPLAEGILTGRFNKETEIKEGMRKSNVLFTEPIFSKALQAIEEIKEIAKEKGMSLPQLSIRWTAEKEIVSSAIVGARKSHHFAENADSFNFKLEKETIDKIDKISEKFQKENLVPSLELWVGNCLKEDLEKIGIKK